MTEKLNDELLNNVSGGALSEEDKDGIICWLRLQKDQNVPFETVLEGLRNDYINKVEYYDLVDTNGNPVSLDDFCNYVKAYWEEV